MAKPRVAVIGTGGTISSIGRDSLDLAAYVETGRKYEPAELLSRWPEVSRFADLVPIPYSAVGSMRIGPTDWLALNEAVHKAVAGEPDLAGVVITHGTSTLEETAYFLHLAVKVEVPVVVIGAQRPATGLSTDAALNLVNAVRLAASPEARGLGVLVPLNDEIQCAREVTKTSTFRLQTFRSPDFGVLGHADVDGIAFYRKPVRRHTRDTEFDARGMNALPRVDILYSYAGSDGAAVDAFVSAGAKGIVSASLAPGYCTPGEVEALDRAVDRGVVVAQSTRVGSGRLVPTNYGRAKSCVLADNLTPQKARVLLMLALAQTSDPAEIQRMFATY